MPGKNGIPDVLDEARHEPVGHVDGDWYERLTGIHLEHADALAEFNTGFIVYHDDLGDYATNEHIMDGTANLALMLSALDDRRKR